MHYHRATSGQGIIIGIFMLILFLLPLTVTAKPNALAINRAQLAKFIHQVWDSNPEIQAARAKVAKADAEYAQSQRAIYNPDLELDGEAVRNEPEDNTYTAGFNQSIDLQNRRQAHTNIGKEQLNAAKASLAEQQLRLATTTFTALVDYRMEQRIVDLAKQRTDLLKEFKIQTDKKFKSGDIGQHSVDQAAFAYAEAIAQLANERVKCIDAKQRLKAITLIPANHWPSLSNTLPKPLHPTPTQKHQWLSHLPSIQLYNAQVTTALAQIKLAETKTHPDPTLKFRGGAEGGQLLVGLGLELPLYVRNNYKDLVHAANQQAIAEEETRLNAYREATAALQGDLARYRVLYQAKRDWQAVSSTSLQHGAHLLTRLWSAGELTTAEYLVKLKQRLDSQIAGEHLRRKAWESWFATMQSSGQLEHWLS